MSYRQPIAMDLKISGLVSWEQQDLEGGGDDSTLQQ